MANTGSFGPHVNDPAERIKHRLNVRTEIVSHLSDSERMTLYHSVRRRLPIEPKKRKIERPFRDERTEG